MSCCSEQKQGAQECKDNEITMLISCTIKTGRLCKMGAVKQYYLIDCRVVDDLIGDVHSALWELFPCLIGHLDSSLHSPAVTICLCQCYCDVLMNPLTAVGTHLGYKTCRAARHHASACILKHGWNGNGMVCQL